MVLVVLVPRVAKPMVIICGKRIQLPMFAVLAGLGLFAGRPSHRRQPPGRRPGRATQATGVAQECRRRPVSRGDPALRKNKRAERGGFEPPVLFPVHSISSAAQSATLPPLRSVINTYNFDRQHSRGL